LPTYRLENIKYNYNDTLETWLVFLRDLRTELNDWIPGIASKEAVVDAKEYLLKLDYAINEIEEDKKNWIVSDIVKDDFTNKITNVKFKPLNISPYCSRLFEQCDKILIMSATILDIKAFCKNVGLDPNTVKFIEVGSEFPIENRPIFKLNTAYLNYKTLELENVQRVITNAVDKIMNIHKNHKGIIHTTSYTQVKFIEKLLSKNNKRRLIHTDPEIKRDEVINKHFDNDEPSVLISPSLYTGLDLKDDQSRFQILVKVPYLNMKDRWINTKKEADGGSIWYNWQTAITLVQACSRSIRSKDDWAKTYILDSAFDDFVRRNKLPLWFTEAIMSTREG